MNQIQENLLEKAANYNDVIYSKSISAFNGYSTSVSARIVVTVDPGGVIKPGNTDFKGAVPGRIQFFTANDDGKLYRAGEFDKAGRFITREHWSVTKSPSGNPLLLMLNSDEPGSGATLSMRRSRGTYDDPTSVEENDSIFKIAWHAHDGQSYKESSSIIALLDDKVSLGTVPSSIILRTFDNETGQPSDSVIINSDKTVSLRSLASLKPNASISLKSPVELARVANEEERDATILDPEPGTLIFLLNLDTVQVYTRTKGWKSLF